MIFRELVWCFCCCCIVINIISINLQYYNTKDTIKGQSRTWSYGSWIYNYLCNHCLWPRMLWVRTSFMTRYTRYNFMWWSLSVTCDRIIVLQVYANYVYLFFAVVIIVVNVVLLMLCIVVMVAYCHIKVTILNNK
jgi:hypothetical protein